MAIKAKLNLFDSTMIVVSLVIGIGIFRTPAMVAGATRTPELFFAAWILGGIISMLGALTFAEIGARFNVPGGYYKVVAECYDSSIAFMFNWAGIVIGGAGAANVALIGAEYLSPILFPAEMINQFLIQSVAAGLIIILLFINYLGIKVGAWTQNLLTMIKIIMILFILFAALTTGNTPTHIDNIIPPTSFLLALGLGFISVFYTYGGYQLTINFGADVNKPKKNIPLSIFFGMGIVLFLYITINYGYYRVLGLDGIMNAKLVAAEVTKICFGNSAYFIISTAIFLSALGFLNVNMMQAPRQWYSMAEDKVLLPIFKKINEKTQVQEFSLLFYGITSLIPLFFLGTFEKIVNYVMFTDAFTIAITASTIFILRKRAGKTDTHDGYKVPFYPVLPAIPVVFLVAVSFNVLISNLEPALFGIVIFFLGYPLFKYMRKINSKIDNKNK
jgi:basic amino acid/polyamine antiporter, APA family